MEEATGSIQIQVTSVIENRRLSNTDRRLAGAAISMKDIIQKVVRIIEERQQARAGTVASPSVTPNVSVSVKQRIVERLRQLASN